MKVGSLAGRTKVRLLSVYLYLCLRVSMSQCVEMIAIGWLNYVQISVYVVGAQHILVCVSCLYKYK